MKDDKRKETINWEQKSYEKESTRIKANTMEKCKGEMGEWKKRRRVKDRKRGKKEKLKEKIKLVI
jgi:hypothetical protein